MKPTPYIKAAVEREKDVLGDLLSKFQSDNLDIQQMKTYSVKEIVGAIIIAFYRGKQLDEDNKREASRTQGKAKCNHKICKKGFCALALCGAEECKIG